MEQNNCEPQGTTSRSEASHHCTHRLLHTTRPSRVILKTNSNSLPQQHSLSRPETLATIWKPANVLVTMGPTTHMSQDNNPCHLPKQWFVRSQTTPTSDSAQSKHSRNLAVTQLSACSLCYPSFQATISCPHTRLANQAHSHNRSPQSTAAPHSPAPKLALLDPYTQTRTLCWTLTPNRRQQHAAACSSRAATVAWRRWRHPAGARRPRPRRTGCAGCG